MALITHKYFTIDITYSEWNKRYMGKIKEVKGEGSILSGVSFEEVQLKFIEKVDEWVPTGRTIH